MEEKADTSRSKHTLLHGETLLVTASHDLEYIALEFFAKSITTDFLGDPLVIKCPELLVELLSQCVPLFLFFLALFWKLTTSPEATSTTYARLLS